MSVTKRDILYHYGGDCTGSWVILPVSGSSFRYLCMGSGSDQPKLPGPGCDLQSGVCKGAGGPAPGGGDGLHHKRSGYTGSDPAIRGKRLASRFQTFLIPDACAGYVQVYFGIPGREDEEILNTGEYQVNLDGELLSQEIMKWQVRSERSFCLAQKVVLCGIEIIVTRVCYETVNG